MWYNAHSFTLWDQSYFFFGLIWFRKADFGICDTHYRWSASFQSCFGSSVICLNSGTRVCLLSLTLELALSLRRPNGGLFVLAAGFCSSSGEQSRSYLRAVCGAERWSSFCFITRRETAWICTDATDHWTSSIWVSFLQCVALCQMKMQLNKAINLYAAFASTSGNFKQ